MEVLDFLLLEIITSRNYYPQERLPILGIVQWFSVVILFHHWLPLLEFLTIGPLFCPQLPRRFDNFCGAGRGPPSPHSARRTPPPRIEVSPWAGASIPGRLLIIGCQSWISPFYLLQFFFFFLSHPSLENLSSFRMKNEEICIVFFFIALNKKIASIKIFY